MHTYAQTQSIVCTDSAELVYFFTAYVHIYIYNHAPNAHNHAPNQTHVQVVTHPLSLSFARSLLLSLALFLSGARAVSLPRSLFPSLSVYFVARAMLFFFSRSYPTMICTLAAPSFLSRYHTGFCWACWRPMPGVCCRQDQKYSW